MSLRNPRNIIVLLFLAVLAIASCTKPDRSEEAMKLSDELVDGAMDDMDTAMNRLMQCADNVDWVVQMRRNNMTISKTMVYAACGQTE